MPAQLASTNLTCCELEVLKWASCGKSYPDIGAILGKSANTVKEQAHRVIVKLDASNMVQAAVNAVRSGII
jgi:DNA-binding NarL/FixJ family response regulator